MKSNWSKRPENVKRVSDTLKESGKHILAPVGRSVSDEVLRASIGVDASPTIPAADMDTIFGTQA